MTEKLMEQKWMVAVFLLVVPALLRAFNLLSESGTVTVWLVVANGFFAAYVTEKVMTKPTSTPTEKATE